MPKLMQPPPSTPVNPVTEIVHGVAITDPYRWLEDGSSSATRKWLEDQVRYTTAYIESISGRDRIRERIREFLAVETYDCVQKLEGRYFFRKRLPGQQQPCIYMRQGADGEDQLLVDPVARGTGPYTSVKPLRISPDGRLLLYEVKNGGERTGTFELLEIETRRRLPYFLPRGYLRGFAFAPDCKSFYYIHEALDAKRPFYRAAYQHFLGSPGNEDREVFFAGEDQRLRLCLTSEKKRLAFFVYRFDDKNFTDIYLTRFGDERLPERIFHGITYVLSLHLLDERILAFTDRDAPNRRIVELRLRSGAEPEWIDIVPEGDMFITNWLVVGDSIFVSYMKDAKHRILGFDLLGKNISEVPIGTDETVRMIDGSPDSDELILEAESFTSPTSIFRYCSKTKAVIPWARKCIRFDAAQFDYSRVWYRSTGGTQIPMFLVGRRDVLRRSENPAIMTSYGGYGVPMTPQFSVLVAFLMEHGCLFCLPGIRGGSEFGPAWHEAAKRRRRQTAYDDFLCAAEWLIENGHTTSKRLAIFGGSNSGLLVGAAMTQRPDLFRAVLCMVPILDMLRYHLFDNAHVWKDEFGTADDPDDFSVLAKYSPYHKVGDGIAYPATMIISGDADRNCNPLHARKMTARLQAANISDHPIFLDYSAFRGHSPVLPLADRVEALTNRVAFLCDQLRVSV